MNLYEQAKNWAISLIYSGYNGWLKNPAMWLPENNSAHISKNKIFPNMGFVQKHRK